MNTNTVIKTWQERAASLSAKEFGNSEIRMRDEEIAELRAALESVQPAAQQDDSDLPQIPPHPDKYMTWREDEIEAIKTYARTALDQRTGSGERFFMDHGLWHDRLTGQHMWTQDQYDEQYRDGLAVGRENAKLAQPDSERDAALLAARAEGRAEAVLIISAMDPEDALNDCMVGIGPCPATGEYDTHWDDAKLRAKFMAGDFTINMETKAELAYYEYTEARMVLQYEAEQRRAAQQGEKGGA